jgi:hypothetical protein
VKLILINRERLQSVGSFLVDEFDSLISRIRGGWKIEHTDDGQHGHVHAQTVASGRLVFSDIVPVNVNTAQVDNYDPGSETAAILRLNSDLSEVTITGLRAPQDENGMVLDGRVLVLENVSSAGTVFRIPHQDTRSFPRNRFDGPRIGDSVTVASSTVEVRLHPASTLVLTYNAAKANWIVHSQSNDSYIGHTEFGTSQNDFQPSLSWRALRTARIAATASNLTISGFLSTNIPDTERKTVVNDGLYTIAILHANTSSAIANRVYCPGGVRYLLHPRESMELQRIAGGGWRVIEKADQWADIAFNAGNFTTDTGTWTVASGDVTTLAYQLDGNKMTVSFDLRTTSVASSPTQLRIALPNGRIIARTMQNPILAKDNGTAVSTAYVEALAGQTYLRIFKDLASTAWSAATDTTELRGQITFMVRDDCAGISEAHTDISHGDTGHQDADHSDVAHVDGAHVDTHSDVAHSDALHGDVAHSDTHSDVAHTDDIHEDVAHVDSAGCNTHTDAAHTDSPHGDNGPHEDHGDIEHQDSGHHGDEPHGDIAHDDTHCDQGHGDTAHVDEAHEDVAHSDSHSDTAHSDQGHSDNAHQDTHSDTPHSDTAHTDQGHSDTAHSDSAHQDIGYHCDTSHIDQ